MQSWGTQSRFPNRDTGLEPSKSGVIGLLCAALGRPRTEAVTDLATLRMGVRVDNPGILRRDYHTAGAGHPKFNARGQEVGTEHATLSDRYYLAGASFAAGLEGPAEVLEMLRLALARPTWQLYLGRKSFVPSQPVLMQIENELPDRPLEDALESAHLTYIGARYVDSLRRSGIPRLRYVFDATGDAGDEIRTDVPISFAARTFSTRRVVVTLKEFTP